MTLLELYGEMKDALRHFDLSFGEMVKVETFIRGKTIVFKYKGREVAVELPQK